jgi:peptidoglycan/xylan/chitin deacetylase (PgdA/CDA1 family)
VTASAAASPHARKHGRLHHFGASAQAQPAPAEENPQLIIDDTPPPPPPAPGDHPDHPEQPTLELLLTFDDGPDLVRTPKVLAALDKRGWKAVFFVNGTKFEKDERAQKLLHTVLEHGHYVGNHTFHHMILCTHIPKAAQEIDSNEDLIERVLDYRPELLRTPYGQHCPKLKQIWEQRDYTNVLWDIDAQEWRPGKSTAQVAGFIIGQLKKMKGRKILLLHDIHEVTIEAIPFIFDWIDHHPEVKVIDWRVLLRPLPHPALIDALGWVRSEVVAAVRDLGAPLAAVANLML